MEASPDPQNSVPQGDGDKSQVSTPLLLQKLAALGRNHKSALAPRIAALLHIPTAVADLEPVPAPYDLPVVAASDAEQAENKEEGVLAGEALGEGRPQPEVETYFRFQLAPPRAGEDDGVRAQVPVLNWDWWLKRRFLKEEDEQRAREAAERVANDPADATTGSGKRRKEQEWVDALYAEFTNVIPHLKRAALLLHTHHQHDGRPSLGWEEELWRERERSPWVACTMLVTYLEKALGDLLCWSTEGRQRVPCRINDLLVEPSLERLLGPDPVYVVRAFLGPPSGINLRNLLWHGFLDNNHFHPAYLDFVMVLVASLGMLLGDAQKEEFCAWEEALHCEETPNESATRRFSRKSRRGRGGVGSSLRRLDSPADRYEKAFSEWVPSGLSPDYVAFEEVRALFSRTHFILPQRVSAWVEALGDWMGCAVEDKSGVRNDYRGLLIALPQFEQSLRQIFVAVNDFAEERLLTAEVAVYYTTLEIMTAERHDPEAYAEGDNYITGDANAPLNLLPIELGEKIMHLLRDLNDWTTGPRLRVKISHGLVNRNKLHPTLFDLLMVSVVALSARYDPSPALQGNFVRRCVSFVEGYRPFFHPLSLMQRRARNCYDMWLHFHNSIVIPDDTMPQPPAADVASKGEDPSVPIEEARRQQQKLQHLVDDVIAQLNSGLENSSPLFGSPIAGSLPGQGEDKENGKDNSSDRLVATWDQDFKAFRHLRKRVFCSKHEESVITVLTDVISVVGELLTEIEAKYGSLGELVRERKAYHQQRRNFAKLRLSLPYFELVVQLVMLLVEETARAQDALESKRLSISPPAPVSADDGACAQEASTKDRKEEAKREKQVIEHSPTFVLSRSIHDLVGRQLACARDNEWERAKEVMSCWLGDDTQSYRLLSHRERDKFWGSFTTLRSALSSSSPADQTLATTNPAGSQS